MKIYLHKCNCSLMNLSRSARLVKVRKVRCVCLGCFLNRAGKTHPETLIQSHLQEVWKWCNWNYLYTYILERLFIKVVKMLFYQYIVLTLRKHLGFCLLLTWAELLHVYQSICGVYILKTLYCWDTEVPIIHLVNMALATPNSWGYFPRNTQNLLRCIP